jgi:predicted Zn finger-like uncharacterized protein
MQVTCSSCQARYAVDPLAIGPNGRTVQCSRCSHRWFETVTQVPEPVPDIVIRPAIHPPALPALIEPRENAAWTKVLVGVVVVVVLLAAGVFAFRNQIATQLPLQWRTVLNIDA